MFTINFYEGSYQFKSDNTDTVDLVAVFKVLVDQKAYRPTTETLWCEIRDSAVSKRYMYKFNELLHYMTYDNVTLKTIK